MKVISPHTHPNVKHPEWIKKWFYLDIESHYNMFERCGGDPEKYVVKSLTGSYQYVISSFLSNPMCPSFIIPTIKIIEGKVYNAKLIWMLMSDNNIYAELYINTNWIRCINYKAKQYGPHNDPPAEAKRIEIENTSFIETF